MRSQKEQVQREGGASDSTALRRKHSWRTEPRRKGNGWCRGVVFQDRASLHSLSCPRIHSADKADLKLTEICQPQPPVAAIKGVHHQRLTSVHILFPDINSNIHFM